MRSSIVLMAKLSRPTSVYGLEIGEALVEVAGRDEHGGRFDLSQATERQRHQTPDEQGGDQQRHQCGGG